MLSLILFLILSSVLVYISKFNYSPVSIQLGTYILEDIPLFYVIIASVLVGLVFSYIIYLIHSITTYFKLRNKNNEIKKDKGEVLELTKQVHQLELENEKLKHSKNIEPDDQNAL